MQLLDALFGLILVLADNPGLASELDVLLGMYFLHVDAKVAKHLEETVLELRQTHFFIEILKVDSGCLLFFRGDLLLIITHWLVFHFLHKYC